MSVGPLNSHSFNIRGWVTTIHKDGEGNIKSIRTSPNLLTYWGADFIASAFGQGNPGATAIYMGLAVTNDQAGAITGPDSADNTISAELAAWTMQARMTGSYAHVANATNWTMSTSWSGLNSSLSAYIYYVGLAFCQSLGGAGVLAKASFAVVSKASQDTLTVAWTFCVTMCTSQ